jgi:glycerophosphoryl diester phosphodiesterase
MKSPLPLPQGRRRDALRCFGAFAMAPLAGRGLAATPGFDLQGHRGARGHAPENTLSGLRTALRQGVHTLEFDIAISADGVPVLAHDLRLNPNFTRSAQGQWLDAPTPALHSLALAELQGYDVGRLRPGTPYAQTFSQQQPVDGERMPTLRAVFEAVQAWGASGVQFNIETKLNPTEPTLTPTPERFAEAVLQEIQRAGFASRCTLQSFDWRSLRAAQRLAPGLRIAALSTQGANFSNVDDSGLWTAGLRLSEHGGSVPRMVKALGAAIWAPNHAQLSEARVREAQSLGLKVIPWTVNDQPTMLKLIDWKVDGLITDYPDRGREAMAARGLALPPRLP